ncbi:M61 family metallopeptidase [Galbibacter mesophilus]|uniref:M61 family metallopeptidase n=1 Tax=Galbibacter mesophilus TaxID=379069 RepID=UPI00191DE6AA|nr:PDZ domain-containing protein [Galbibacter mesophilus]MCM5662703.1 PDZ domain-containing protein [Galbibacter mesophilus]
MKNWYLDQKLVIDSKFFALKQLITLTIIICGSLFLKAQEPVTYNVSFDNAVHHEAEITVAFPKTTSDSLHFRMSRSSPGRYALHEFAKNVYGVMAFNEAGDTLQIVRSNPYEWVVPNPEGKTTVKYTLFANRADGTYSQINESNAHLNMSATFMYADAFFNHPVEVEFEVREDLNWKVATQLEKKTDTKYSAPNFQYFMDSPTVISDYKKRSFTVTSNGKEYTIEFVLHDTASGELLDEYFDKVKRIVIAEKEVFGELPDFDFGRYTFLANYTGHASGDGMEHRNSTILTDSEGLADGGMENNIGTVSHEFFHAWNVERLRPKELEPFNFSKANMTGSLWFAEGFTSYYTNLILCRAEVITPEEYAKSLNRTFNYVWNSPAREYFNPIEMSYQAPFVDAATSVDPVNRENTFISYYSYGSMLGLALDLSLRQNGLNLDDYMKKLWEEYGKKEIPYTIDDLHFTLSLYAGKPFADTFFNNYIYKSGMPNYGELFESVGFEFAQDDEKPFAGFTVNNGNVITRNVQKGTPAYLANLSLGDEIISVNGEKLEGNESLEKLLSEKKVGEELTIKYKRFGEEKTTKIKLVADPTYKITYDEKARRRVRKHREAWLKQK